MNLVESIEGLERTFNTPLLVVLIGPSCSGKSTEALSCKWLEDEIYIFSRDNERINLFGEYRMGNNREENLVTNILDVKTENHLKENNIVILDNTHLKWDYIKPLLERYNEIADVYYHLMPETPLLMLKQRQDNRCLATGKCVPEKVIVDMFNQYNILRKEWEEQEYPTFFPVEEKLTILTT